MSAAWLVFMTPYLIQVLRDNWQESDMVRFVLGCMFTTVSLATMVFLLVESISGFRWEVIVSDEGIRASV